MSATAQTFASPAVKTTQKRVSGWSQLMRLIPYVSRHKGEVAFGMVTQIGMGITGTLLPLIIDKHLRSHLKKEQKSLSTAKCQFTFYPFQPCFHFQPHGIPIIQVRTRARYVT